MDFFERQDKARRNTKLLVAYFIVAVIMLVLAIYLAVVLIFSGIAMKTGHHPTTIWNPKLFGGVAIGTLAVIICGSLFKTLELARGGTAVASMLGGRPINPSTDDPDERKLLNVVEEMSLASGVPVPQVYLLEDEEGINAFAAGQSTSDAVIGVTRGCVKLLNRDELQGVIAHEFSHILNGDMRLNLRLIGTIFGIVCITVIGRILLRSGSRSRYYLYARNKGGNPLPVLGLALIIIGWIGVLFGRLIQAAVSRQREYLADASAVQFTRNPAGLTGALKKIGGLIYGSKLESAHAQEASHMFFSNGLGEAFFEMMATHPPLKDRIQAIDPAFDGVFPPISAAEEPEAGPAKVSAAKHSPFPFPFPAAPQSHAGVAGLAPAGIAAAAVVPSVGAPTSQHLHYAVALRNSFPESVRTAARTPLGATALMYSLLLSNRPDIREAQMQQIAQASDEESQETAHLLPDIDAIAVRAKLPLADLALPALRRLSPEQYQAFNQTIGALIEADGEIDLFEYVLQKVILRHLDPHFTGVRKPVVQFYSLKPLTAECSVLLSGLARIGTGDPSQAEAAFRQGARLLEAQSGVPLTYVPDNECDLSHIDAALNCLSQAAPQIKKNTINACAQTVAADGLIQELEAELLRAIADTLDCPMPPFIQSPPT